MKVPILALGPPKWVAVVSLLLSSPWSIAAQSVTSTVLGIVTDQSGAVVSGARLTVTNQETGINYSAITNEAGRYRVPGLPSGHYDIRFERENFKTEIRRGVTLSVAQQVEINLVLKVGAITEEVTTTAEAPLVESTTSAVSGLVNGRQMRELPLNGRDLYQLVLLQAGANPTPSAGPNPFAKGGQTKAAINGMRPTSNNVTIDGMDANNPTFHFTPGGTSGLLLGVEAIREFRVFTQTYSAEYGRNAGAIIEAITKSGGNSVHGSLFEFHRNAALDAKNYFDPADRPIPPFTRNQFGGSLGGPMERDRTFYFLSYEGLRERLGITANTTVPNRLAHRGLLPSRANPGACTPSSTSGCVNVGVDSRIRPILDLFPLPNGPDFGDGTGQIGSSNKRNTDEDHVLARLVQ